MHTRLGFMGDKASNIVYKMTQQNAFPHGRIDCDRELNLGTYAGEKDRVKEACYEVAELKVKGISEYQERITVELSKIITRHIMEMVNKGIFHPINMQLGGMLGTSIYQGTHDALFKGKLANSNLPLQDKEELLAKAEEFTENQKRAVREGFEPVKLGSKLMFFNPATGYYVDIDKLYDKSVKESLKPETQKKPTSSPKAKPENHNKKSPPPPKEFPNLEKATYNLGEHIVPGTMIFKEETLVATAGRFEMPEDEAAKASHEVLERKKEVLKSLHHELTRAENSNQLFVFKQLDKFWIIGKHAADAMIVMSEEKFASQYPKAYNSAKSSLREAGGYIAMKVNAVDGTFTSFLGDKYTAGKEAVFDIIEGVNENAPQIVKDGIAMITLGGAGAAAFKGTKHIVNMAGLPKLASKMDVKGFLAKGGTKTDSMHHVPDMKVKHVDTAKPVSPPKPEVKTDLPSKPVKVESTATPVHSSAPKVDTTPDMHKYEFANSKVTMSYFDDTYHHTKSFKPYDIRESYRPISSDWYTKVKESAIRVEVTNAETQSFVKYGKLKEELLGEAHLAHGDVQKLWDNGLSIKDVKRYGGELVNDLINQPDFKDIATKWGQGFDGTNQLVEHTMFRKPGRIAKIEKFLELESNALTDIFSKDSAARMQALKKFDEVSDDVMAKATLKNTNLKDGKQEAYYVPSLTDPEEGVIVLKYKGKKQTMMPGDEDYFETHFGVKP